MIKIVNRELSNTLFYSLNLQLFIMFLFRLWFYKFSIVYQLFLKLEKQQYLQNMYIYFFWIFDECTFYYNKTNIFSSYIRNGKKQEQLYVYLCKTELSSAANHSKWSKFSTFGKCTELGRFGPLNKTNQLIKPIENEGSLFLKFNSKIKSADLTSELSLKS